MNLACTLTGGILAGYLLRTTSERWKREQEEIRLKSPIRRPIEEMLISDKFCGTIYGFCENGYGLKCRTKEGMYFYVSLERYPDQDAVYLRVIQRPFLDGRIGTWRTVHDCPVLKFREFLEDFKKQGCLSATTDPRLLLVGNASYFLLNYQ